MRDKAYEEWPSSPVILSEAKNLKLYPYSQARRFLTAFGMTGRGVLFLHKLSSCIGHEDIIVGRFRWM